MLGLCLIQMLVLGVFCATVRASMVCFNETELAERAERKLKNHFPQYLDLALQETADEKRCPVGQFAALGKDEVKDRSISPWRLVYDTNENRFPRKLAVAQCLCDGCITIKSGSNSGGTEDHTYNSREVLQDVTVLMKRPCEKDGEADKYILVPEYFKLPVGCTCVKPKRHRN